MQNKIGHCGPICVESCAGYRQASVWKDSVFDIAEFFAQGHGSAQHLFPERGLEPG